MVRLEADREPAHAEVARLLRDERSALARRHRQLHELLTVQLANPHSTWRHVEGRVCLQTVLEAVEELAREAYVEAWTTAESETRIAEARRRVRDHQTPIKLEAACERTHLPEDHVVIARRDDAVGALLGLARERMHDALGPGSTVTIRATTSYEATTVAPETTRRDA